MLDRIPTPGQEGRVLVTPEDGNAPFYAKIQMADNPTQEGTPLSKATLLQDATAVLFGLNMDAVPDDVLQLLGGIQRFQRGLGNEYVWAKYGEYLKDVVLMEDTTTVIGFPASSVSTSHDVYSNAVIIDGNITLLGKTSTSGSNLVGYYAEWNGGYYSIVSYDGWSNYQNLFTAKKLYIGQEPAAGLVGYVNSPDPNAYPPAIDDGYTYTALGQLGKKAQIATGSYAGTGKYGPSNKIKLNLGFRPKFVLCSTASGLTTQDFSSTTYYTYSFIWSEGVTSQLGGYWKRGDHSGFMSNSFEAVNDGFEFYGDSVDQTIGGKNYNFHTTINEPGDTYFYVAVG